MRPNWNSFWFGPKVFGDLLLNPVQWQITIICMEWHSWLLHLCGDSDSTRRQSLCTKFYRTAARPFIVPPESGSVLNPDSNLRARIFLADDREQILKLATELLSERFEIVGSAQNGLAALQGIESTRPDILLLDLSMPVLDGFAVMHRLQEQDSPVKVVVLTVEEDEEFVIAAFHYGARAYVSKARMGHDLIPAVDEVLAERTFTSSSILRSRSSSALRPAE